MDKNTFEFSPSLTFFAFQSARFGNGGPTATHSAQNKSLCFPADAQCTATCRSEAFQRRLRQFIERPSCVRSCVRSLLSSFCMLCKVFVACTLGTYANTLKALEFRSVASFLSLEPAPALGCWILDCIILRSVFHKNFLNFEHPFFNSSFRLFSKKLMMVSRESSNKINDNKECTIK